MTRKEQMQFVKDITHNIEQSVDYAISRGAVPEAWDGHELRCYLALLFSREAHVSTIHKKPRGARARRYREELQNNPRL